MMNRRAPLHPQTSSLRSLLAKRACLGSRRCAATVAVLPLFALALTVGCSIELGVAPFFCNNGSPACPDGYRCETAAGSARGVCLKEGESLPGPKPADAQPGDGQPRPDADGGTGPRPDAPPPPPHSDIVISEVMANPQAVLDAAGEYIELFNITDSPIDINGWTLTDNGSDTHTINAGGQLIVLPKRYLVLGASIDTTSNGGVPVAYALDNFTLGDAIDDVILIDTLGKVVDKIGYSTTTGFVIQEGASLSLKNPLRDRSDATNWCVETKIWPGSAGDRGTPGGGPGCL